MKIILASEIEHLLPYEESYNALLKESGGIEALYYSLDYIRTSLKIFQALGASLFYIVVLEDENIIAVLPFQMVVDGIFGLRRTIQFWGALDIYAVNTHRTVLVRGGRTDAIDAAINFLNVDLRAKWDSITLLWLKTNDEHLNYLRSKFPNAKIEARDTGFYYYNTEEDLTQQLGTRKGSDLRRRRRRLEEDFGTVSMDASTKISPADLSEVKRIHTARQEFKQNDGAFFSRPLEDRYISDLCNLWSEQGCVHYYSLRVGGKLIAFQIMVHSLEVTYVFIMAFDSDFYKYAPLRILTYDASLHEIEHFHTKRIEFGWGGNQLKEDYSSGTHDLYDAIILNRGARSRIVRGMIDLIYRTRQRFRALDDLIRAIKKAS